MAKRAIIKTEVGVVDLQSRPRPRDRSAVGINVKPQHDGESNKHCPRQLPERRESWE